MNNSRRVLINTLAQYLRTIFNVVLALYSTRLVLQALGSSDYGLYSVIAGVVAMLSFVTNALVISTQRYLSFFHGAKETNQIYKVFTNSLIIHITISIFLFIILFLIKNIVIQHLLDIPVNRVDAAATVYMVVVCMVCLSFITSPFKALYVARENIVYISVVDVIDAILKVLAAVMLSKFLYDKLVLYSFFLGCISLFNLFAFSTYAFRNYDECVLPKFRYVDKGLLLKLLSFASWTLYSNGCVVMRTQGIAIVVNRFFGVILNASLGIATQVNGALANVSQAIANALSPQIIKAEGDGNREKMLRLAGLESKYAFFMLGVVAVPIIFELPLIFNLWLGYIPESAVLFTRFIMVACLCDQITVGLGIANQAIGNIKSYSLVFGTLKFLTVPLSVLALYLYNAPFVLAVCYVSMELATSIVRLFFLRKTAGLNIGLFVTKFIAPSMMAVMVSFISCFVISLLSNWKYRLILMYPVSTILMFIILYITMTESEKAIINNIITKKK